MKYSPDQGTWIKYVNDVLGRPAALCNGFYFQAARSQAEITKFRAWFRREVKAGRIDLDNQHKYYQSVTPTKERN